MPESLLSICVLFFSIAQFSLQILCIGISIEMLRLVYFSFRPCEEEGQAFGKIATFKEFPLVTLQIPICNDGHVLSATLEKVRQLDYPRSKMEIQVLDDSDLQFQSLVNSTVQFYLMKGMPIRLLRRDMGRKGAKAGNLNYGLKFAEGAYLAVFDADAQPAADFVLVAIGKLEIQPRLAMVQASWTFRNRNQNILTRIQALLYDAIAQVQQSTRSNLGEPFHFHGSGALWRKSALLELGAWNEKALGEDLELSIRAELAQWKFIHLSKLKVDIELVPDFRKYLVQQERWVIGQIQVLRTYGLRMFNTQLSIKDRFLILGHLSHPLLHPLLVLFMVGQLLSGFKVFALVSPFPSGTGSLVLALSLGSFFAFIWRGAVLSGNSGLEVFTFYPFLILRYCLTAIFQSRGVLKFGLVRDLEFRPTPKQ